MLRSISLVLLAFLVVERADAQELRIVTWNIEHLGSSGRGLGGIGAGNLGRRNQAQLHQIADFIRDDLQADVVAVQEAVLSRVTANGPESDPLETIVNRMGQSWQYVIGPSNDDDPDPDEVHNVHNAFIWDSAQVNLLASFEFDFPNFRVGAKRLFDRLPLAGYFEAIQNGNGTNDFLLVNVHLTSGQQNDENHLAAMVILEQNITRTLQFHGLRESDRIILGDFNDNPFATNANGTPRYSDFLYQYMAFKRYEDLVSAQTGATRMDSNLTSIIDHVLANNSARNHLTVTAVDRFQPQNATNAGLAQWRQTFSDHFPLTIRMRIENADDDVD